MDKAKELKKIAEEISKCKECKINKFGFPVVGEGNVNSRIIFVGEAPGPNESRVGRPFVGRSGKFLDKLLISVGINRKRVFITSPVKFYPGKRNLTKEEILHGSKHLKKQIEIINPKLLVLLGNTAVLAVLGKKLSVNKFHGKLINYNNRKCFITFHPSAAMRFPKINSAIKRDFVKLKSLLNKLES